MAIKYRCPGCGREDVAPEEMTRQRVPCAGCGAVIRLPSVAGESTQGQAIRFRCDGCGKSLTAPAHLAGKKITCKACGRTGIKIPGAPASTSSSSVSTRPRPAPASEPAIAGPAAVDLFGLDEAPLSPQPTRGADDLFADSGASPTVAPAASEEALPPRNKAFEPMSAEKKKKVNKRADKITKEKPSFAGAGMGVSFGTIIAITLFGWRLYRIGHRVTRALDDPPVAGAGFEPGAKFDPKAAAAEMDSDVERMLKEPGAAEAREWLDPAKFPNHGVFEMGNDRARAMTAGFYERGAKRVSVVDVSPMGNALITNTIAVELPSEADKRKQCLEWEVQYLEGEDPTADVGQKYLLIPTD
jgi:ribosomal protein S27E